MIHKHTLMTKNEKNTHCAFSRAQYEVLMNALQIAGAVYGVMGDMVDEKYKIQSDQLDALERYLLENAEEIGLHAMVDVFEGKKIVDEQYLNKAIDDLTEYEEYSFWDNLARKLADRDVLRKVGEEKLRAMDAMEYINAEYPLESAYHKEFEEYGIERIRVEDKKDGVLHT